MGDLRRDERGAGGRFGWITDESVTRPRSEQEILRTDHFIALPSIGALVPGWTLVVPRRPMPNLSEASQGERQELERVVTLIGDRLADQAGTPYCFEHGGNAKGSLVGCGVDQAHLHIVPLDFDLLEAALSRPDGALIWRPLTFADNPLDMLPADHEYVAIWRLADRQTLIGYVQRPVSQWVRRVIADQLGIGKEWNYQTHPQIQNVRLTLKVLSGLTTATW